MKKIVLIGGGGHCRSTIDVIESSGEYAICGILDASEPKGVKINGYSVIGDDSDIPDLYHSGCFFCITVGQIKTSVIRNNIYNQLKKMNAVLPVIISKYAIVSSRAEVKVGTVVFHNAIINSNSIVGECCIVNTGAIIEHDVSVGSFCHISTSVCINGGVRIGDDVFVGSNSTIIQGITICSGVIIGAGSLILNNISSPGVYVGNPIRRIE